MKIPSAFYLQNTKSTGIGLFCKNFIEKDTIVVKEEGYYLGTYDQVGPIRVQVGENLFLDYKKHPHFLDFVNHSCNPNMKYDVEKYCFWSIKDISPYTKLTYDYETTEEDLLIDNTGFVCRCNSKNCRGKINGFHYV